ncbi:DUF4365 domain-containing protein [Aquisphaera insulae]|uniref:DUF4365 domain-containing protein n=1 Tax=Aquisphaera insulae TaxID=2712864 RepID=UPI0034E2D36E
MSYAYLHMVASRAGFGCEVSNRHLDNAAADAVVREDGRRLDPGSLLTSFDLHVQLKATARPPIFQAGYFPHRLPLKQYNRLRSIRVYSPRLLVVLHLHPDPARWLEHGEESVSLWGVAYWMSLKGASASANRSSQTVYLPSHQVLSVDSLTRLMTRVSRREEIVHESRTTGVRPGESRQSGRD